jgi:hypothetical protein
LLEWKRSGEGGGDGGTFFFFGEGFEFCESGIKPKSGRRRGREECLNPEL